jgi:hypothetical protein
MSANPHEGPSLVKIIRNVPKFCQHGKHLHTGWRESYMVYGEEAGLRITDNHQLRALL